MRRTYNRERYLDRVALIREHVPDCALTTDIIVGFPGETEADFEQTLEVVEEVGYDGAFTFVYSPRRGTEAATLTRARCRTRSRSSAWSAWWRSSSAAPASGRSGSWAARWVLVEGPSRTDPGRLRGRSRHNKVVNFDGPGVARRARRGRDRRGDEPDAQRAGHHCWPAPPQQGGGDRLPSADHPGQGSRPRARRRAHTTAKVVTTMSDNAIQPAACRIRPRSESAQIRRTRTSRIRMST